MRLAVLPARLLASRQQLVLKRAQENVRKSAQHGLLSLRIKLEGQVRFGQLKASEASSQMKNIINRQLIEEMKKRNANIFQPLLPLMFNLPLIVMFSSTLKKMSALPWPFIPSVQELGNPVDGWNEGGLLFFADLAQSSLPLTAMVTVSSAVTVHWLLCRESSITALTSTRKLFYFALQGLNLISFCILSLLPAVSCHYFEVVLFCSPSIFLFWSTMS